MNEEERCNTTLGLGNGVVIKREKQPKQPKNNNKRGLWLDLSLPLHPKIEANDGDDHMNNDDKDDQDSSTSKTFDDDEEEHAIMIKKSIDNTNVCNSNHGSRKKLKLTTEQTTLLEDSFNICSTHNMGQKQELAKKLNLLPRQIEVWFQNRRARTKLKQIEQECEMLKRCCETLNDENHKLKKELQIVRCCSLKFDHHRHQEPSLQPSLPFYIRDPATAVHYTGNKVGSSGGDKKTVAVVNGGTMGQMDA